MKSHRFVLVWLILGIPIISYLLLQKTFNLALYGDDWLQLYNLWLSFDVHKTLSFFDIKSYLSSYWPQYFFLGIIRHFFGYAAPAYFAASLLLRILATISLFFLAIELSKSRLAAFLATLIFTFSVAGLQTTDWVFNMNTYAGIIFLNLAMIAYLKIRQLKTFFSWNYIVFIILFTLALAVVPVRMHGAIFFIMTTELFLYIFLDKKNILKFDRFLISRLALPAIIIFALVKAGSFVLGGEFSQLTNNFLYLQDMVQKGKYDILFYFLGIIGNFSIPDTFNTAIFSGHISKMMVFFTLLGLLITLAIKGNKLTYGLIILFNLLWAITGKLLILWNPDLSFANLFSISVGFQSIFLSFLVFRYTQKTYPKLAASIIVGMFWIISFSLLYWLRTRFLIIESTSRYMTMGAVGFSILLAGLLSIMFDGLKKTDSKKSAFFIIPVILLIGWLGINFNAAQFYLNNLETNRNLVLADKTWATLKRSVPELELNAPSVFYFTSDNSAAVNMVLVFGFWPHAGLSYSIPNWENTPLPTENYKELLNMVKTGEPLRALHARKAIPVPLSRVFAFDFRNGELVSITGLIRQQLSKDLTLIQ